jgi:hypothetical protein
VDQVCWRVVVVVVLFELQQKMDSKNLASVPKRATLELKTQKKNVWLNKSI